MPRSNPDGSVGGASKFRSKERPQRVDLQTWEIDGGLLWDAVRAVCNEGAGLLFSFTRNGSALVVAVYEGGKGDPEYIHTLSQLVERLEELRDVNGTSP
jgi:hypothetical protein